jgi:hypothetical protein
MVQLEGKKYNFKDNYNNFKVIFNEGLIKIRVIKYRIIFNFIFTNKNQLSDIFNNLKFIIY